MILTIAAAATAFVFAPQPVDPQARVVCLDLRAQLEGEARSRVRSFIVYHERRGHISYDDAADLEYEVELLLRPIVERLHEMAYDPEMTTDRCRDYFVKAAGPVVDHLNDLQHDVVDR